MASDIQARKDALAKIRTGFNTAAVAMNDGGSTLAPYASAYQPAIVAFNEVVSALNGAGPAIVAAIDATDAEVTDPPVPQQSSGNLRVGDNTTYWYADWALRAGWGGGTWLDLDGVAQGPKPFASAPANLGPVSLDLLPMMPRLLQDNQGIILLGDATFGGATFNPPHCVITKVDGTSVDCPLILAKKLDDNVGGGPTMGLPAVLRFDYSGLTDIKAASLNLSCTVAGTQVNAFYLNTYPILDDLSHETKRANEATQADIFWSHKWTTAEAAIAAGWTPVTYINAWNQPISEGHTTFTRLDGRLDIYAPEQAGSGSGAHLRSILPLPGQVGPAPKELFVTFEFLMGGGCRRHGRL